MIDEKTEFCQPCTEAPMTKKEIRAKSKAERKELKRLKKERKLREKDKFHRVRGIVPYTRLIPYIMETRNTSQNFIFDKIGMEKIDKYIKRKQEEGLANLTLMHVIVGAYCRAVSQRPAINRFIRGQKIYSRKKIEISHDSRSLLLFRKGDKVLHVEDLSSGEKQLLLLLVTVFLMDKQKAILFMDEPEVSLHISWQQALIDNLKRLNPNCQIVLATHSPSIISLGWGDKVVQTEDLLRAWEI